MLIFYGTYFLIKISTVQGWPLQIWAGWVTILSYDLFWSRQVSEVERCI